jgi:hypothetical protein
MRAIVIMRPRRRLEQTVKRLWLPAAGAARQRAPAALVGLWRLPAQAHGQASAVVKLSGFEAGQLGADVDPFVRALL